MNTGAIAFLVADMMGHRKMRVVQVVTTGLVWGGALLGLLGCSSGSGGSARSARDESSESSSGSAVEELDAVVGRLEAAADGVVAPLDRADEVLKRLEELVASVGQGAREEVVRIVVTVVNTGDAEISAEFAQREDTEMHAEASTVSENEAVAGDEKVVLEEAPSERQEGAAVVAGLEPSTDTVRTDVRSKETVDTEMLERAKEVGLELRALLSSLAATPARAKHLAVVAKDTLMAVPNLGAQAVASAQLKANSPFGGAAAQAEGQAELAKVQEIVQRVQARIAEIQQQAVSLPPRAAKFGARAQQILAGAMLTPPPPDVEEGGALANLEVPAAEEPIERVAAPSERSYQWGWLAVSGVSGVAAAVGGIVAMNAQQELMVCHEPSSHGCANYTRLHNERTAGLIILSAGAAVMTTTFIGGFVANKKSNPASEVGASLSCGAGFAAVQCAGAF